MGQNGGTSGRPHQPPFPGMAPLPMPTSAEQLMQMQRMVEMQMQQIQMQMQQMNGMESAPQRTTPFHQPESQSQSAPYNPGFGKPKPGRTLADSRDSWRSDSTSWRSGGGRGGAGNPTQTSTTWKTHSSAWGENGSGAGGGGGGGGGEIQGDSEMQLLMQMMQMTPGDRKGERPERPERLMREHAGTSEQFPFGAPPGAPPGAPFGTGGGRHGMMPFGRSKSTRRYPTEMLFRIYRQLLYGGRLGLPGGLSRDEPMLFTTAGEVVNVVEQLQGVSRRPKNAYIDRTSFYHPASRFEDSSIRDFDSVRRSGEFDSTEVAGIGMGMNGSMGSGMGMMMQGSLPMHPMPVLVHQAPQQAPQQVPQQVPQQAPPQAPQHALPPPPQPPQQSDTYMYVDPQGQWQGPFQRSEMLEWHAAGFFPLDLVVKSATGTQLGKLSDWLAMWNGVLPPASMAVPGPVPPQVPQEQQQVQQVQQQQQQQQQQVQQVQQQQAEATPLSPHQNQNGSHHTVKSLEEIQRIQQLETLDQSLDVLETPPTAPEAPWTGSQSIESTVSLRDIQQEEDARKAELDEVKAKVAAQQRKLKNSSSGWASVTKSESSSLADIQNEEMKASESKHAVEAAAAAASLEKHQAKVAGGGRWAAAASKPAAVQAQAAASVPVPQSARRTKPVAKPPPPPPPPEKPRAMPSPIKVVADNAPMDSAAFGIETPTSDQGALSGDFREWCSQQMMSLTGSAEVTLCEFLMGVESNSEIADYVGMYLGTSAAVATFSSEFIKRKLAIMTARELSSKKKSRKARAKANKALASVSTSASGGQGSSKKVEEDSSWEKVAKGGKGAVERTMSTSSSGAPLSTTGRTKAGFALLGKGH